MNNSSLTSEDLSSDTTVRTDIPMNIEDLLADLKKAEGSTAKTAHKLISDILKQDRNREANQTKIVRLLDKIQSHIEQNSFPLNEQVRTWLNNYRAEFDRWIASIRQRFGADLADRLQTSGIDLRGQAPKLSAGLFTIELHAERNKVTIWYGPLQERLVDSPMQAAEVCKRIEKFQKELGSNLDPPLFVEKMKQALRRISSMEGQEGKRIPIGHVLPELAFLVQSNRFLANPVRQNYRSYSRADFSYDLFRCAEEEQFRRCFQLVVATRMHTQKKADYLWVPSDRSGQGSCYSHIIAHED